MNNLTKALLGSVSLAALVNVPAIAGATHAVHVQALHAGRQVNKTKLPNRGATHVTYTFGVYTYISASASLKKTVPLPFTFYRWTYSGCSSGPPVKVTAQKRSEYGRIGIATETYTDTACGQGVKTQFYGNTYKLMSPDAKGKVDHFVSTQIFKYKRDGGRYKATLNLDVNVYLE